MIKIYQNMVLPRAGLATFNASIQKIDTALGADSLRWCMRPSTRRPDSDFKPGKLAHYLAVLTSGAPMPMPEFYLAGRNVDIMDGRHRIYALFQTGHTHVTICCKEQDRIQLASRLS